MYKGRINKNVLNKGPSCENALSEYQSNSKSLASVICSMPKIQILLVKDLLKPIFIMGILYSL